jgi:FkbM family methyltransferase
MNLIFDIGFNVGEFTQTCFSKYPNCNVVAVEAKPTLVNNASPHLFTNYKFTLHNKLVSNTDGDEMDFYVSPYATGVSTASTEFMENSRFTKGSKNLPENSIKWNEPIKIKSITVDSMIERYGMPDLIKIDVEGYEYNVLLSLTKNHCPLSFEWSEEKVREMVDTVEYLFSLGYTKFAVQLEDRYDAIIEDDQWMAKEKILEFFFNHLIPGRKKIWGMIWAS